MKLLYFITTFLLVCVMTSKCVKKERVFSTKGNFKICPRSCKGSCYYEIKSSSIFSTFQWPAADNKCKSTHKNSHLANIYNKKCYNAIRQQLINKESRGEFLIGMKYNKFQGTRNDKINYYNSGEKTKNPQWYRRRPNRIGDHEMVLIIGKEPIFSGLRNIVNGRPHHKMLCEIEKK